MLQNFQPPIRYHSCTFEHYIPDKHYPSQKDTKRYLEHYIERLNRKSFLKKLFNFSAPQKNLYIDGFYGVGKTHLLASCYNSCTQKKCYMSFTDFMAFISYYSMQKVIKMLKDTRLICIDEFELDDPANTMKAANFLKHVFQNGSTVITTSNTIPSLLGKGQFGYKNFEHEIGTISNSFEQIQIDGIDYRTKKEHLYQKITSLQKILPQKEGMSSLSFQQLVVLLKETSLIHYQKLSTKYESWTFHDMIPFKNQDQALRFCYFIDKLYDANKTIFIHFKKEHSILFIDEFLHGTYQQKYYRCLSRLQEMKR